MSETFGLPPSKGNGLEDTLFHDEDSPSLGVSNPLWHSDHFEDELTFYSEDGTLDQDGDPLLIVDPFSTYEEQSKLYQQARRRPFPRAKPSKASSGYLVIIGLIGTFGVIGVFTTPRRNATAPPLADTCHADRDRSLSTIEEIFANASSYCDESFDGQCTCQSPLQPADASLAHSSQWIQAFEEHKASVEGVTDPLDVVFLGESIVSSWVRHFGDEEEDDLNVDGQAVFEELFTVQKGGRVQGLTLGIDNDKCGNLLYRLENGEIPNHLDPKVWWIMIGTDDIVSDHCSVDAMEGGILRIVETISRLRPNAKIVLNSIVPPEQMANGDDNTNSPTVAMNRRLQCFAETSDRLAYFDATTFIGGSVQDSTQQQLRSGDNNNNRNRDLTEPHHRYSLSNIFRKWGDAMVNTVLDLLSEESP